MFGILKGQPQRRKRLQRWNAPSEWRSIEDDTARQHRARTRSQDDMRRWMAQTGLL